MDMSHGLSTASNRQEIVHGLQSLLKTLTENCSNPCERTSGPALECLLHCITPHFIGSLTQSEQEDLLLKCFQVTHPVVAITAFCNALSSKDGIPQSGLPKALWILDGFLSTRLQNLFNYFTEIDGSAMSEQRKEFGLSVVQDMVSLPEKISNRCNGAESNNYQISRYLQFISRATVSTLRNTHSRLAINKSTDLTFTANIVKRFQSAGYGEELLRIIIPFLGSCFIEGDYVWPRISQRILIHSDLKIGEALIVSILSKCREKNVRNFLGDTALSKPTVSHLLCSKLLLQKIFDRQLRIPSKIASYLFVSHRNLFDTTFLNLLDAWADKGSILHSDPAQRRYICQAVIEFSRLLSKDDVPRLQSGVIEKMLRGMSAHLDSALPEIRIHGMVVGETLSTLFGSGEKLEFDYDKDSMYVELLQPFEPNLDTDLDEPLDNMILREDEALANEGAFDETRAVLDSDDDEFEPYDMPESEKSPVADAPSDAKKTKPPVYIRDCLQGLSEQKEPHVFDAAFFAAESLVRKGAVGLPEVAGDLTRRLLSLEDRFSSENFEDKRKAILVACCVKQPETVVRLLAQEVFSRHYTMSQRVLMLDTIREAANELSEVKILAKPPQEVKKASGDSKDVPSWKAEVDARIEAKTRRFSKRPVDKPTGPVPTKNRFSSIAGIFFHPLLSLYQSSNQTWLDLLGRDYYLLGKLLFTLGAVIRCSENSPSLLGLVQSLFLVVWELRSHPEPFVRQGLLYCVAMGFSVLPPVLNDPVLLDSISDIRQWLGPIAEDSQQGEMQKMAAAALNLAPSEPYANMQ